MDHLWTPWRSTYMKAKDRPGGCIFCIAAADPARDEELLVVWRGESCFVILNRYPYTSGHLMIVPYLHVPKLTAIPAESAFEMMTLARRSEKALFESYHPDGMNLGMNLGAAAGAGIEPHIHLHVVPRWSGDANFMSTVGGTRIIPEDLSTTFHKVKKALMHAEAAE